MNVQEQDTQKITAEEQVLKAMISSTAALAKIASVWGEGEHFTSPWAGRIAGWCVEHMNQFNAAPGKDVRALFSSWAERQHDLGEVKLVEAFLGPYLEVVERFPDREAMENSVNADYTLDVAAKLFTRNKIEKVARAALDDLISGRIDRAQGKMEGFSKVEIGVDEVIDLFADEDEVVDAFDEKTNKPLVVMPDDFGLFYGNSLEREGFFVYLAGEKVGKTWALVDMAIRACTQRRRVAFFEVGDMSKKQIKRRLFGRIAQRPWASPGGVWPLAVDWPKKIAYERGEEIATVFRESRVFNKPLQAKGAWRARTKFLQEINTTEDDWLKLGVYPNSSINVHGIRTVLRDLERRKGWVPDLVVIDYADILAPPPGSSKMDYRDQINTNWKQLRRMSMELRCLVVTATQANAASYTKRILDRSNFSDDKRKLASPTAMAGINVTAEEKEQGIYRLNWIALREEESSPNKCLHVAGCLRACVPAVTCVWPYKYPNQLAVKPAAAS